MAPLLAPTWGFDKMLIRHITAARRPRGPDLFRGVVCLEPAVRTCTSRGLLGDAAAVGMFYLVGPAIVARLVQPLAEGLTRLHPGTAATWLSNGAGPLVRALARCVDDLRAVQDLLLSSARQQLRGRGVSEAVKP
jgi:hypothetical protein